MADGPLVAEEIWRPILEKLNAHAFKVLSRADEIAPGVEQNAFFQNMWYLIEHKLVKANMKRANYERFLWFGQAEITTKGMDFLMADGGLTKRLRTITVELDAQTIKALLVDRVDEADADEGEKSKIKQAIRSLPASALTSLTGELVKRGLGSAADLVPWLEKALHHL